MNEQYEIYGYQLSYFTRKVQAAFELKGIQASYRPKTLWVKRRVERRAGTHQVPVVRTPHGVFLRDSTPIIEYLDAQFGDPILFPSGTDGVLVRLLEEWFDEWFPRVVLHYRWNYEENAVWASDRISREVMPKSPKFIRKFMGDKVAQWGRRAVRSLGFESHKMRENSEALVERVCRALDEQLERTPFALGHVPTAVDAVLLGALRAHLLADPISKSRLSSFSRVRAWADNPPTPATTDVNAASDEPNGFARTILAEMRGTYQEFMLKNAQAIRDEEKLVYLSDGQELVSVLSRLEPERSRVRAVSAIRALADGQEGNVKHRLAEYGLLKLFWDNG